MPEACALLLLLLLPAQSDLARAQQALSAGQYRAALEALSAIEARDAQWHALSAQAYDGINDPARAVQEFEEALRLDPDKPAYHVQLAQVFLSRNTPAAALDILTEAQARFPESFVVRLGRGLAEKELQLYDQAERSLRWCLRQQPGAALAFDALATVELHRSRFAEVRKLAEDFLKQNPSDYRGYYFLAAGRDGDLMPAAQTRELVAQSIQRKPAFAAAHALLGKIALRENNVAEAVESLKRAVQLRPDLVQAHLSLARALKASGDASGSAREFETVRQLKAKEQEPVPSLTYHRGSR